MEKVKLTKEQIYELEQSKIYYGYDKYKELILKNYLKKDLTSMEWQDLIFLYKFNLEELMTILLDEYELEKTPEQIILERFNRPEYVKKDFSEGVRFGIRFTLNAYGHKIKGINY